MAYGGLLLVAIVGVLLLELRYLPGVGVGGLFMSMEGLGGGGLLGGRVFILRV